MRNTVRLFLALEVASFVLAALVHFGVLTRGYEHGSAATAESVIGTVLLVAFALTWALPARTPLIGIAGQAFALLGTLLGAFMIAIGIGPRTVPDLVYHAAILLALAWGLLVAARAPAAELGARGATHGATRPAS